MSELDIVMIFILGILEGWWLGRYGYLFHLPSWLSRKPEGLK